MPNTVTVELPPGKLFTCPGLDWHLKHETGLNDNVCREGIKLEEALKPLLNLACEERHRFHLHNKAHEYYRHQNCF